MACVLVLFIIITRSPTCNLRDAESVVTRRRKLTTHADPETLHSLRRPASPPSTQNVPIQTSKAVYRTSLRQLHSTSQADESPLRNGLQMTGALSYCISTSQQSMAIWTAVRMKAKSFPTGKRGICHHLQTVCTNLQPFGRICALHFDTIRN